jgi:hypothetical protein
MAWRSDHQRHFTGTKLNHGARREDPQCRNEKARDREVGLIGSLSLKLCQGLIGRQWLRARSRSQ